MKSLFRKTVVITLVLAMVFGAAGCSCFRKTNKGHTDLAWYMNITEEKEGGKEVKYTSKEGDVVAVALEDKYADDYGIVKDGDCFVTVDTVKENIDDRLYWDKNENLVLFTDATTVFDYEVGGRLAPKDGRPAFTTSFVEDGKCYVNMKLLDGHVECDHKLIKAKKKCPAILSLSYNTEYLKEGVLDDDIEMRTNGDYQNLIVTELKEDTKVQIVEENKNWDKVKTDDGFIGYVPISEIDDIKKGKKVYETDDDTYTHQQVNGKVNMVWDAVYNQTANANIKNEIAHIKGVNVISPTWFEIETKNGGVTSRANDDYIKTAHKNGMEVWALLDDFKSKKIDHYVLTHTSSRERLIANLMDTIDAIGIDGINIDFEYVTEGIADDYLQLLRELSVECRTRKLKLSVDNYAAMGHTAYYDWKQQYKIADYVIFMNYDEHNAGDDEAGSVSSLPFMENAITTSVDEIGDSKRIINGMPFFTRLWEMTPEGKGSNKGTFVEDAAEGNYYLSSEALTMNLAEKAYKKAKVKPTFDKESGQNYVEWEKGSTTYQMWLEDDTSVAARLKLSKKYKLGGNAYWALGQEKDSIWDVIEANK